MILTRNETWNNYNILVIYEGEKSVRFGVKKAQALVRHMEAIKNLAHSPDQLQVTIPFDGFSLTLLKFEAVLIYHHSHRVRSFSQTPEFVQEIEQVQKPNEYETDSMYDD